MNTRARGKLAGFTLVELMIVVVIMGLLAAIAIPAFTRYIRKARTAEASGNISRITMGEVTAYQQTADSTLAHFITAPSTGGATPSGDPSQNKYPANPALWTSDPGWTELDFSIDTGHFYQYQAIVGGGGAVMVSLMLNIRGLTSTSSDGGGSPSFQVAAYGDLDGDGEQSAFWREGTLVGGEIQLSAVRIAEELE